jgi:hypothetical protein
MRTLTSLLATAALVGGVTIASAQQSGSPTAPSGPMAGGGSSSKATQGVGGTNLGYLASGRRRSILCRVRQKGGTP